VRRYFAPGGTNPSTGPWQPDGVQGSALGKLLGDKRLGVTGTTRNWSTVTKLLALANAS
jgi:uncharacterized protein (DUF1697 family)